MTPKYEYDYLAIRPSDAKAELNTRGAQGWGIAAAHFGERGDVVHVLLFRPKQD